MSYQAANEGMKGIILSADNGPEAALVDGMEVIGAKNLKEVIAFLSGNSALIPFVSVVPCDDQGDLPDEKICG